MVYFDKFLYMYIYIANTFYDAGDVASGYRIFTHKQNKFSKKSFHTPRKQEGWAI